ncbi:MAG TPA: CDP-alcohol phosphatidyltransferase family protein [Xanthomonadales bacterium]|nr:CDP-alcohol phosphatidyltransferase family protein [Xanthomonadales bacterium]
MSLHLLPNTLTLFRMLSVGPIVYFLLTGRYRSAFLVALCAGISDLLDGFLARKFGWMTHFGGILDPLADKLMLVTLSVTLAWLGYLPIWLVGLMVFRDLLIIAGAWFFHNYVARITSAQPSILSKWNTLFQIMLVVCVMLALAFPATDGPWTGWLISIVAVTTVLSGAHYVWVWTDRAMRLHATRSTTKEHASEK